MPKLEKLGDFPKVTEQFREQIVNNYWTPRWSKDKKTCKAIINARKKSTKIEVIKEKQE
jgi:hypothetical protein